MSKWHPFDLNKGYRQKRPPIYKLVLVKVDTTDYKHCIVVGYRKNSGGDKSLPYFVIPGFPTTGQFPKVTAWRDCLDITVDENLWNPKLKWTYFY